MKYFQHDTNARTNRKIRKVLRTHGPTGLAIWWALLEELYQADETGFQIEADELWLETLAESLCISDHRTLIRVFDTFADVGLIAAQLWAEHSLHVGGIQGRSDRYTQKKAQNAARQARFRDKQKHEKRVSNALRNAESNEVTLPDPDPDPEIRSQIQDLDPDFLANDRDLRVLPPAGQACVEAGVKLSERSSSAGRQHASTSVQEPSNASATQPDSGKVKQARRSKTKRNVDFYPDEFAIWWDTYRRFCVRVDAAIAPNQKRGEAAYAWDQLFLECRFEETAGLLGEIREATEFYVQVKERQRVQKGEAIGIEHGCRFLSKRTWESVLAYKRDKENSGGLQTAQRDKDVRQPLGKTLRRDDLGVLLAKLQIAALAWLVDERIRKELPPDVVAEVSANPAYGTAVQQSELSHLSTAETDAITYGLERLLAWRTGQ